MARDVKEVIDVLMRVLGGEEITQADVEDLGFEGEGDVQAARAERPYSAAFNTCGLPERN
ncbi:MAG TPA: hypothetical protein VFB68_01940 [Xanthobacteraceae bacterium]|nr:hypothetical protein [Xanthobacteraceae bacterium]